DQDRAAAARQQQHALVPIRDEAGQPRHAGLTCWIGVDRQDIDTGLRHCGLHASDTRVEYAFRQLGFGPGNETAPHVYTGISNNWAGVRVSRSQPVCVTTTTSPSTM